MNRPGSRTIRVRRVRAGGSALEDDELAIEEPLEIRVAKAGDRTEPPTSLSVTMRTPGHDFELAVGFLFTEGILRSREDLRSVGLAREHVGGAADNVVDVVLQPDVSFDLSRARRNFYTTSSCGVCGKASIDAIRVAGVTRPPRDRPRVQAALVPQLPDRLREGQALFASTGGLHAAGRFDSEGHLLTLREDVGRHNAVDKLIGERVLAGGTPLHQEVLVVSGRASFEVLQKAAVAGFPFVVAVGAPSSLAVDLAQEFGITLAGFARGGGFNVYAGERRVGEPVITRSSS